MFRRGCSLHEVVFAKHFGDVHILHSGALGAVMACLTGIADANKQTITGSLIRFPDTSCQACAWI